MELVVVLVAGMGTTSPFKTQQLLSGAARDHPSVIKVLIRFINIENIHHFPLWRRWAVPSF